MNTVTLEEGGKIICISIPMTFKKRGGRKEIILPQGVRREDRPSERLSALQSNLARAFRWQEMLESGEVKSMTDLSKKVRLERTYLARLLQLTTLAPDIVDAIVNGTEPSGLSLARLTDPLPRLWAEQREAFAFPAPANAGAA